MNLNVYMFIVSIIMILFLLIIIILMAYLTLIDSHKKKQRKKTSIFYDRYNLRRKEPDEKHQAMSLDEYIEYRKVHFSNFAAQAFEMLSDSKDEKLDEKLEEYELELDYYWECKKNLNLYQPDILKLWDEFLSLLNKRLYGLEGFKGDLIFLAKLTRLSEFDQKDREKLDTRLLESIEKNYPNENHNSFKDKLIYILNWSDFRMNYGYLDLMNLGVTISELESLRRFWNKFESDFMKLKNENPSLSKEFYKITRNYFQKFSEKMNVRFQKFFKEVSVWVREIFKNEDSINQYSINQYSDVIITYRRVARKSKKGFKLWWDLILDHTARYGEKPILLLYYFLMIVFFLTLLYYPYNFSPFEFKGISKDDYWITSIINVLYFNFTTMISNSYGNISPENEISKLVVILQQLLGFILSGGFIALFLRKLFRD